MSANQRPTNWRKVLGDKGTAMLGEAASSGGTGLMVFGRDKLTARKLARRGLVGFSEGCAGLSPRVTITEFGKLLLRGAATLSWKS